eukprot:1770866-Rhodomonas_salina.3
MHLANHESECNSFQRSFPVNPGCTHAVGVTRGGEWSALLVCERAGDEGGRAPALCCPAKSTQAPAFSAQIAPRIAFDLEV